MPARSSALTSPKKKRRRRRDGHIPVLAETVLRGLNPPPGALILDGTFGGGGHTASFLRSIPDSRVIALDRDPAAEPRVAALEQEFPGRISFHGVNFRDLPDLSLPPLDSALFDIGVSSFQLDQAERGFSFRFDAPLDMRMDPRSGLSASAFLQTASREALVEAIRDFGEEPSWRRVVDTLLQARQSGFVPSTTGELVKLLEGCLPPRRPGRSSIHPATLSFQGLRMAVNGELEALAAVIPATFERLKPGGRLAIISFHSLEDRIVKRAFRQLAGRPEHAGDSRPQDERLVQARLVQSKPFAPTAGEIIANPRSRSARLRIIEKL
jgi:16S rRNA (cytosine1402-N4)-methyltransferase